MAKQLSDFEKAFAAARAKYKADKGTNPLDPKYNFDFKGKKYNVEYAEEMKARKGGKSSSAAPSKSSDSSGAPSKGTGAPIRKRTLEDMQKEGKETKFYKDAVKENEDQWSKDKDTMADIAITGASLLGPGMALRGARAGYNAYKGYKAAKAAAKTAKAFEGVGKYRQGIRTVEGELLPREAARAAAPKRLAGPSPQNRLPPPQGKLPPPQRRLTGPQQQPQPQSPPPPSTNTAVAVKGKDSPFTPPPSGMPKLETAVKNMKERKPLSERAKARARRNKDLAAYERGDITQREYIRGEIEPFKSGGKVKKYSGKEGSEVKKDKPYLGPREQADVSKMEKMQKQSKTPIGDIEPVPGHYGKKKYAKGGKVEKESKGMNCGGMAKYGRGGGIERRGSGAGTVIKMKSGGVVDGCAQRGKTKGKVC